MKKTILTSLVTLLASWSCVAGAEETAPTVTNGAAVLVESAGTCPYGYKEMPTYKWDKAAHRWIYVGYSCYPSGGY